jgi:hypothetical protein
MSLVSNERGALSIENEACRLSTSCECDIHLTFLDLVHVTISRDCEKIAILILCGAV